ncbi:MAG TPA: hypothetical protein VHA37_07200 [Candidatus Saccharimonadales bacterium]|nr:hypothetical protein [Candidatus Saccharimonadales bacterium]
MEKREIERREGGVGEDDCGNGGQQKNDAACGLKPYEPEERLYQLTYRPLVNLRKRTRHDTMLPIS